MYSMAEELESELPFHFNVPPPLIGVPFLATRFGFTLARKIQSVFTTYTMRRLTFAPSRNSGPLVVTLTNLPDTARLVACRPVT